MKKIEIDKNVPIPTRIKGSNKELYKTFENMKAGDSFAIPIVDEEGSTTRNRLYMAARNFKFHKNVPWSFTSRVIGDEARIWRIS